MTYENERVVTHTDEQVAGPQGHSVTESTVTRRASPVATVERLIIFIFGLIQALLVMRIVLLLLAAREANPIVSFVYDVSEIFVAPFRGMFAMDSVPAGQAALDVAAIVALIGWTLLELVILALVRVFRPSATA
ncbi:MAG TPA: YggT family protein [Candidatus Limnocylindria bacterium]|nr:YggT family protein [Candidatus Limnocylindria bacterium]